MKCADYIGVVDADSHVNIYALATVKETSQRFVSCEAIWIEKPHIELKVCKITESLFSYTVIVMAAPVAEWFREDVSKSFGVTAIGSSLARVTCDTNKVLLFRW